MNWCKDLIITYNYASKIAKEKYGKVLCIFDFEDMVKDFKKKDKSSI